jgi:hypothetical protein
LAFSASFLAAFAFLASDAWSAIAAGMAPASAVTKIVSVACFDLCFFVVCFIVFGGVRWVVFDVDVCGFGFVGKTYLIRIISGTASWQKLIPYVASTIAP